MLPAKLKYSESYRLLFDRYNALVDYLHKTRLVSGHGINICNKPTGTVVAAVSQGTASAAETPGADDYNGFFKIVDVSTENEHRIMVVDGSTFNRWEETSAQSVCHIEPSGATKYVDPWKSEPIDSQVRYHYIILQYRHDGEQELVSIHLVNNKPQTYPTLKYYQIGYVFFYNGEMHIVQEHQTGIISLSGCGPSTLDFGISAFYSEPDYSQGRPAVNVLKLRVNAGRVRVGYSYVNVPQNEYNIDSEYLGVYLGVHVSFPQDQSSAVYTAEIITVTSTSGHPPSASNFWYTLIGRLYSESGWVYQDDSGLIEPVRVWL